jgi:hypothetical protein
LLAAREQKENPSAHGQHVMPLKDLMQNNPIKESAKSWSKKDDCACGKLTSVFFKSRKALHDHTQVTNLKQKTSE